jgi:hypothetical protein
MCWAKIEFGTPKKAAASLNAATRRYIRDLAAGKNPAVPDVLWDGADSWLLHNKHCRAFNRKVRDVVLSDTAR